MKNISWREWSDEAFRESEEARKPVLLSISAVWCHWCHVMDQSTYSLPAVYEFINEHFIPIRVDSDRNPDINARYNMGGWPSTVFLTSERDVMTGATYLPTDQMLVLLQRISEVYGSDHSDVVERARENSDSMARQFSIGQGRDTSATDVENVVRTVRSTYDTQHGGFGRDQKFPHPEALRLLMFSYEHTRAEDDLQKVTFTLDSMIKGAMFDPVEGGMFRYATRRDWTEPHFEKMLDDNAKIAKVLLNAYRLTRRDEYLQTARSVFAYIENTLMDSGSDIAFGSQDADEEYYSRDCDGRNAMKAPAVDTAIYIDSNCLLARAYLKLYGIGRDRSARDRALRIVTFFNSLPRGEDGSVCHFVEGGETHGYGNLGDLAELAMANVACAEATGDSSFSKVAEELAAAANANFTLNGAWSDISTLRAERRKLRRYATPTPENAVLAAALVKLTDLTENPQHRQVAAGVLDRLAGQYGSYGILAAGYAMAVAMAQSEPLVVTVYARPDDLDDERFVQAAVGVCGENCTVRVVARASDDEPANAAVCAGPACRALVMNPDQMDVELSGAMADIGYGI